MSTVQAIANHCTLTSRFLRIEYYPHMLKSESKELRSQGACKQLIKVTKMGGNEGNTDTAHALTGMELLADLVTIVIQC